MRATYASSNIFCKFIDHFEFQWVLVWFKTYLGVLACIKVEGRVLGYRVDVVVVCKLS
jgi:hypothetical protein